MRAPRVHLQIWTIGRLPLRSCNCADSASLNIILNVILFPGRETQLRSSFYSPLNSMWQATLGGGGKAYSLDTAKSYSASGSGSGSGLPGFYSTGYPPTPPKDSQTPEDPSSGGPSRTGAGGGDDYINSSLSSSISSEDLMSSDMKPTPESLMGFSFPYSSRKIQEGMRY